MSLSFITRNGTQLLQNGGVFRFSGANLYWLGLIEDPSVSYPSQYEIDYALSTASEMGLTVIRAHTLGISVGNSLSVWPTRGSTNTTAFNTIDYAIYKAGLLGLRLIIPLVDNWHYYHGGKHTFTDWRSVAETAFYTDSNVIADFEAYISVILNRVNQYNSVAYKNDPTIMAWQLGNELTTPYPGTTWTSTIATYIQSIDSNHLLMDGTGLGDGSYDTSNLSNAAIDIFSNHYYPTLDSTMTTNVATIAAANKVFIADEYDWTPSLAGNGTLTQDSTTAASGGGSNSAKVVSGTATTYWYVQLLQNGLTLTSGHSYTFTFWVKASVTASLTVAIQSDTSPFTTYTQTVYSTVGTTWTQYTMTLTAPTTDTNAMIVFNCAQTVASFWFDLVSFSDNANGTNLITNPSFESAITSPWHLNVKNIAHDDLPVFLAAVEANPTISGALFWSLWPQSSAGVYVMHNEVFSMYYPGTTDDMGQRIQYIMSHAKTMQRGIAVTNKAWMGNL